MRITRAAKVAAFPLIVLALVALIACQGPIGNTGETGETGEIGKTGPPGGTGDTGDRGPMGYSALIMKVGVDTLVTINDGKDADNMPTLGVGTEMRAMASFFSGGSNMVTFSAAAIAAAADEMMNMADVSDDGTTVSIKLKAGAGEYDPMNGYVVRITAKDEVLGVTQTQDLMVVRNSAPVAGGSAIPSPHHRYAAG